MHKTISSEEITSSIVNGLHELRNISTSNLTTGYEQIVPQPDKGCCDPCPNCNKCRKCGRHICNPPTVVGPISIQPTVIPNWPSHTNIGDPWPPSNTTLT